MVNFIPSLYNILQALIVVMAIRFFIAPLFWMFVYEIKYGRDAGLKYLEFGKEYFKKVK
jgi:hypothetical protein